MPSSRAAGPFMIVPVACRRRLLCIVAALAVALSGCEPEDDLSDVDLTGYWAGERVEDAALQLWLVHNAPDGGIHIRFSTCLAGQVVAASEHFGVVWMEDDVYRTTIQRIVREDEDVVELTDDDQLQYDYDILELSDSRMVYRFIGNPPLVYTVNRVSEDYEMQCPPAARTVDTSARGRRGADGWIRRGSAEKVEGEDGAGQAGAEADATDGDETRAEPVDGHAADDSPDTD